MSLETYTGNIADLVTTNPTPTDPKSQGDDHLRGIKYTLQQTFPGFDGPLTASRVPFTPVGGIAANNVQDAIVASGVPSGAVMDFAMNSAPAGWLACDGSAVSRTTYAALFAVIGTTWGAGDSSTTFNVPDMRGYFRRGAGTNSDGTASGAFAAKQGDAFKEHIHQMQYANAGGAATTTISRGNIENTGVFFETTGATSGSDTETRPKNIAVLTCIKV